MPAHAESNQETDAFFQQLVDHALHGVLVLQDTRIVYANQSMEELSGYVAAELLALTIEELQQRLFPPDQDDVLAWMDGGANASASECREFRIIRKDGTQRWLECHRAQTVFQGRPAVHLTGYDVTQRKESEARYRTLVETLPDAVLLTDLDTTIRLCNRQALAMLGYHSPDELIGQRGADLVVLPDEPLAALRAITDASNTQQVEYTLRRKDGHTFPAELRSATVQDIPGEASAVIVILRDISMRKQLQAQLIASVRIALGGRLAASVAHEVNTPLQAVQNLLELIARTDAASQREYLDLASQEVQRAGRIIRHFLDLYRPSTSVEGAVSVQVVLDRILALLEQRMHDQHIQLDYPAPVDPLYVRMHPDALTQVLLNLVINALDVMPHGGTLNLGTRIVDARGTEPAGMISIRDTGPGIAFGNQEHIFEPFGTGNPSSRELSLFISNDLVVHAGGRIILESMQGRGSTFSVVLPLANELDESSAR